MEQPTYHRICYNLSGTVDEGKVDTIIGITVKNADFSGGEVTGVLVDASGYIVSRELFPGLGGSSKVKIPWSDMVCCKPVKI